MGDISCTGQPCDRLRPQKIHICFFSPKDVSVCSRCDRDSLILLLLCTCVLSAVRYYLCRRGLPLCGEGGDGLLLLHEFMRLVLLNPPMFIFASEKSEMVLGKCEQETHVLLGTAGIALLQAANYRQCFAEPDN